MSSLVSFPVWERHYVKSSIINTCKCHSGRRWGVGGGGGGCFDICKRTPRTPLVFFSYSARTVFNYFMKSAPAKREPGMLYSVTINSLLICCALINLTVLLIIIIQLRPPVIYSIETLTTINGQDGGGIFPKPCNGKSKWHEEVYHCAANHNKGWQLNLLLRGNFNQQWNTINN